MKRYFKIIYLISAILFLSACSQDSAKFVAGDMRKDFCGVHLNYQYCECAFNNEFCEEIALGKSEAKDYVQKEYEAWVLKESMAFAERCGKDNGIYKKEECRYCDEGKIVIDGKCKKDKNAKAEETKVVGECSNDIDCPSVCENNNLLTRKCNLDNKKCEEVSVRDCSLDLESFGDSVFPMLCENNTCVRDVMSIQKKREELEAELAGYSEKVAEENGGRSALGAALAASRQYCQADEFLFDSEKLSSYISEIEKAIAEPKDENFPQVDFKTLEDLKNNTELNDEEITQIKNIICNFEVYFQSALDQAPVGDQEFHQKVKEIEIMLESLPE